MMVEQILFWPISELMRLAHVFHRIDAPEEIETDDLFGYYAGISITLASIALGLVLGIFFSLPIPISVLWLLLYLVGAFIEFLFSGLQWSFTWWIRTFLDGLVVGMTLRILVLPG